MLYRIVKRTVNNEVDYFVQTGFLYLFWSSIRQWVTDEFGHGFLTRIYFNSPQEAKDFMSKKYPKVKKEVVEIINT